MLRSFGRFSSVLSLTPCTCSSLQFACGNTNFSPGLRHKHKCLQSIVRRCTRNPSETNQSRKRVAEDSFRVEAESTKLSYESRLIDDFASSNSSMIYKYIGNLRQGSDIPSTVYHGSDRASSDADRANMFNRYFHSIFTVSSMSLPAHCDLPDCSPLLCSINISDSDVFAVLSSLDVTKAKGLDGLGPSVLKFCALALYQPLHHLFQISLSQHTLRTLHAITPVLSLGIGGL